MNCLSHAWRVLDQSPYFVTGVVLPDWLTLVARKTRIPRRTAREWVESEDGEVASLAKGIARHHHDDEWFHGSRAFAELNLGFSVELRDLLGADAGFRPYFTAHIVIEMLLDAWIALRDPAALPTFYQLIEYVDPGSVQANVNRMTARPTDKITWFIPHFCRERYLYDYAEDSRVRYRMNRILGGIGLASLPVEFETWLVNARETVYSRAAELLTEPDRGVASLEMKGQAGL